MRTGWRRRVSTCTTYLLIPKNVVTNGILHARTALTNSVLSIQKLKTNHGSALLIPCRITTSLIFLPTVVALGVIILRGWAFPVMRSTISLEKDTSVAPSTFPWCLIVPPKTLYRVVIFGQVMRTTYTILRTRQSFTITHTTLF